MLSTRSRFDGRPNRLSAMLGERRARGRAALDLTESNPTTAGVPYDEARIRAALAAPGALAYEPSSFGLPSARRAVADLWRERGVAVEPGRVMLTASTSEAYAFLFKLLCDPGDRVAVPSPSYPLFEHLARYEGVEVAPYRLDYDGAWHVDVESLRSAVSGRTRAVVLVSPNNPTGSFVKRAELARVAALGLPVISDEVFGAYAFEDDPHRPRSALEADGPLVFALDGLSKYAALPQMKLAWITVGGPEPLVAESLAALELLADTFLSPGSPVQHALPELLAASATTRAALRDRTRRNRGVLRQVFAGTSVTPLDVEGGWYAVLRLPNVQSEDEWVLGLLESRDVLVQPGWFYDFETEPHLVVSLITREATFRDGIERIAVHVEGR